MSHSRRLTKVPWPPFTVRRSLPAEPIMVNRGLARRSLTGITPRLFSILTATTSRLFCRAESRRLSTRRSLSVVGFARVAGVPTSSAPSGWAGGVGVRGPGRPVGRGRRPGPSRGANFGALCICGVHAAPKFEYLVSRREQKRRKWPWLSPGHAKSAGPWPPTRAPGAAGAHPFTEEVRQRPTHRPRPQQDKPQANTPRPVQT